MKKGYLLDIGCRDRKEEHFTGIDSKRRDGVDIVHDLESFPYPLKDGSCITIKAAHVIEHIKPWLIFDWFNEMWRLLIPNGQLAISAPYALSPGFVNDPSHCLCINEATFQHLDPMYPLYKQHEPKPWKIQFSSWRTGGNIEAIMSKRPIEDSDTIDLATKAIMMDAIQKKSELSALVNMLRNIDLKVVVEIGTARGGVFYALCQLANPSAKLISIDLPYGSFGGGYSEEDAERFRSFGKPKQDLYFIRKDSHKAATLADLKKLLKGDMIDLLFIDGDHTYKGVKKDWEMYSPLVREGGLVVFHDICHHTFVPTCEVDRLWGEIRKGHEIYEFIDPLDVTWGGIGVLRMKRQRQVRQTRIERKAK